MRRLTAAVVLLSALSSPANSAERNVLVEMFTNSHCVLCPPAHTSLQAYGSLSPNASKVRYVYYHVPFPYPDDLLAQVGAADAASRNQYYGPFTATPVTFFDGVNQGNAYASWSSSLDSRVGVSTPLTITLQGSRFGDSIRVSAAIQAAGTVPAGALAFHVVLVENVSYAGRNGVTPQNYVMRKLITGGSGEVFAIADGEMKVVEKASDIASVGTPDNAGVVVFVQEVASRAVLQSQYISYGILSGVSGGEQPRKFLLEQNYPNPFNPSTEIVFELPEAGDVRLAVFDLLGREVADLVNGRIEAGRHAVKFDAAGLAGGVYFYRLVASSVGGGARQFSQSGKMILAR